MPSTVLISVLKYKTATESISRSYRSSHHDVSNGAETTKKERNSIEFGNVLIRIYAQTIGDNPSVSRGPPLQLDWDWKGVESLPLSTTADRDHAPPNNGVIDGASAHVTYPKPVSKIDMRRRTEILRDNGVTTSQIQYFQKIAVVTRKKRMETIRKLPRADFEERLEEMRGCLLCWKRRDSNALVKQCQSNEQNPPVTSTVEDPCQNCCELCLNNSQKAFFKMYKCDGKMCKA